MTKRGDPLLLIAGVGILLGVYAAAMLLIKGHGWTANTSSATPWGLQIATYIFFVLISAGCTFVNFFGNIFFRELYKPLATRVVALGLLVALAGLGALATDLGRPERMLNFVFSPNIKSPMWGMFLFYIVYIPVIALEYLDIRKGKNSPRLMWAAFLVGIALYLTMGSIFGITEARPYYFGSFTTLYFLSTAFLSGSALVILVAILTQGAKPAVKTAVEPVRTFFMTGLGVLAVVSLWRFVIGRWSNAEGYEIFRLVELKLLILALIGIVLPYSLAFMKKTSHLIAAAALVLATQFVSLYGFVLDGFRIPVFRTLSAPRPESYSPFLTEIFILAASASFVVFLYKMAEKKGMLEPVK